MYEYFGFSLPYKVAGSAFTKEERANGMLIFYFLQINSGGEREGF